MEKNIADKMVFMKKMLFILISLFLFSSVSASGVVQFKALSDRCTFLSDGQVRIHVRLLSLTKGKVLSIIPKYNIGKIYNGEDKKNVSIQNIKGPIKGIELDNLKDQNDYSSVYFEIKEDLSLEIMEEVLSFDVIYTFDEQVPSKVYVLGSEVTVGENREVCDALNHFDFYKEEEQSLVLVDYKEKRSYLKEIVFGCVFIVFCFSLFLVRRKVLKEV